MTDDAHSSSGGNKTSRSTILIRPLFARPSRREIESLFEKGVFEVLPRKTVRESANVLRKKFPRR